MLRQTLFGRQSIKSAFALITIPATVKQSHIPKTLLPFLVNIVTFIKNVQELYAYILLGLEKGVACLSARLNPQEGPSGTPALLRHLRGVNNVLSTGTGLVRLPHHVLLDIS